MKMLSICVVFDGDKDEVLLSQLDQLKQAFPEKVLRAGHCEGSNVDIYSRVAAVGKLMSREFSAPTQFTLELPKGGKK